jgi:DNA recombination protein RmuC
MNFVSLAICSMLALIVGIAITWVYFNGKLLRERDRVVAQIELGLASANGQVSIMTARAKTQDDVITSQDNIIKEFNSQKTQLDLDLRKAMSAQAVAEQQTTQIPVLAGELTAARNEASGLREQLTSIKQEKARIDESLIQERTKAVEMIEVTKIAERKHSEQQHNRLVELSDELAMSKEDVKNLRDDLSKLKEEKAKLDETLEQERSKAAEKIEAINLAEQKLSDAFKALASEALSSNNKSFLDLAKSQFEVIQKESVGELEKRRQSIDETMKPVKESLDKVDLKINELEKARAGAYSALNGQLESLVMTQSLLQKETARLVGALGTPAVRGQWGEIQLKRVVEMAGMVDRCDFYEQENRNTEEGRIRPDMVIKLPGKKNIVIDAKAPMKAYLEALELTEDDGAYRSKMKEHSTQIRSHITSLSKKKYAKEFDSETEFVILFLPGEVFFSAALQHDKGLIEFGVELDVIIATPTTLIALLRAVAYGWRQEALEQNAKQIGVLGRELYERIAKSAEHLSKLGKNLDSAVKSYDALVGSVEGRVLVTARKFKDLETASHQEIETITPIGKITRNLMAPELTNLDSLLDATESIT